MRDPKDTTSSTLEGAEFHARLEADDDPHGDWPDGFDPDDEDEDEDEDEYNRCGCNDYHCPCDA